VKRKYKRGDVSDVFSPSKGAGGEKEIGDGKRYLGGVDCGVGES